MNEIFEGLEHFESAEPARRSSRYVDYGSFWQLTGWAGRWRVYYIKNTSEVYAMGEYGEPLMLLGTFPIDPDAGPGEIYYNGLDRFLEGWEDRSGSLGGMDWLIEKMAQAGPAGIYTHLFGRRGENGAGTALCGAQDAKNPVSLPARQDPGKTCLMPGLHGALERAGSNRLSERAARPSARAKSAEEARNSQTWGEHHESRAAIRYKNANGLEQPKEWRAP